MAPSTPPNEPSVQFADAARAELRVVLIGQPNVGKSSLFNRLTGLRQRVGNYPGVTVERKEGRGRLAGTAFTVVDLPGTYSLNALSLDEEISVRALAGHPDIGPVPDVIVCVVDAGKLHRSLLPAFQAGTLGRPMVLALNFFDEAKAEGWRFDLARLEEKLGIPVVPTVGHQGEGVAQLKEAIVRTAREGRVMRPVSWPEAVSRGLQEIEAHLDPAGDAAARRFRAQRLLFDTAIRSTDPQAGADGRLEAVIHRARAELERAGLAPSTAEPVLLHREISRVLEGCLEKTGEVSRGLTARLDAVLVHPVWGLLIFGLLMFGVFQAVYTWATPLMETIEAGTAWAQAMVSGWLEGTPVFQSLVADGIVGGIGSVVVFLPQILILTLLVALLEDCGYLARAAFLIDRVLGWCGLSGKSFVPLMSGYACAIPAIMASRTI
ncbi:MAG: ferrous iron transport protein B, partial [Verrucomicrobiia bacterium]